MLKKRPLRGLSRTEVIVLLSLLGLLALALPPSVSAARRIGRASDCSGQLGQIAAALAAYQADNADYLPCAEPNRVAAWSESAWYLSKRDLWFYQVVPQYLKDPNELICPQDPFAAQFNFDAVDPNGVLHGDVTVPSCGYGLNYALSHWGMKRPSATPPLWPDRTLLLTEVGPDDALQTAVLYASGDYSTLAQPWRDGGRVVWDDGNRPWAQGAPTWLTTRHGTGINGAAMDGSVRKIRTVEALALPLKAKYYNCQRYILCSTSVCPFCENGSPDLGMYHYDFSDSTFWWWTGRFPNFPY